MRRMGVGGYSGYSAPPSDDDDVGEHELCPQVQAWVEARSAREYGTALHESGHCVAALALRKPIDSLVLFSDRAGVFRHYPPAKSAPTPPSKPVVIEPSDPALHDSITIDLAGLAAEMKAPIGSTDFAAGISGDMGQVHRLLDRHCVNAAQKRFLIWYCTDRAHDIINANWPIVEALARALQRMRLMSKLDILEAVRSAGAVGYALLGEQPPSTLRVRHASPQTTPMGIRYDGRMPA